MKKQIVFACFGDSITSDQVTGTGTRVGQLLGVDRIENYACGYATGSDWHDGERNITRITLDVPPNTSTSDNVLSNQIRRLLADMTELGNEVIYEGPDHEKYSAGEGLKGTGRLDGPPDILYIAVGINDGNHTENAFIYESNSFRKTSYRNLQRVSFVESLAWALETLKAVCPSAKIFCATPLAACAEDAWMQEDVIQLKRQAVMDVCDALSVSVIDSYQESGFTKAIAAKHGFVHPDAEWKEKIAVFVADAIKKNVEKKNT